jgi:hypothetical protein
MPYQFDFDSTNRILRGRLDGCVTDAVLKEYYRAVARYVAELDPIGGITDFSAVTSFEVSVDTVRDLARSAPAMPDPSRVRVILAPVDSVFGMSRLFQFEGEDTRPQNHVVRTIGQAWAVLGVQDPKFETLPNK